MHTTPLKDETISNNLAFNAKLIREYRVELDFMLNMKRLADPGFDKRASVSDIYGALTEMILGGIPSDRPELKSHTLKFAESFSRTNPLEMNLCTLAYDRMISRDICPMTPYDGDDVMRAFSFMASYANDEFTKYLINITTSSVES